jgi:D-alanyl-D-alanine carboxypeptidase
VAVLASACSSSGSGSGATTTTAATASTTTTVVPAATTTIPPAPSAQLTEAVGQVTSALQSMGVPGGVVAASVAGQGSAVAPFGTSGPGGPAMTADMAFRIASLTKTFTATAVLRLVDQGELDLTATLDTWVPGIPNGSSITLTQLMDHTSGIYDYASDPSFVRALQANPAQTWTPQQLVTWATSQPPYFAPGGGYHYSDTNYVLLGMVLQQVTGSPAADVIAGQVVQPAGLGRTGMVSGTAAPPPTSAPSQVVVDSQGADPRVSAATAVDASAYGTAGGMYSTAGDLLAWAQELGTGSLLSPSSQQARLQVVSTGQVVPPLHDLGGSASYPMAYGLGISTICGMLCHDGIIEGWNSSIGYLPSAQATFVILLNAETVQSGPSGTTPLDPATYGAVALAQLLAPGALSTN